MRPSFSLPPLDEVVLGVQFTSPASYNTLHLNEIYKLFEAEYPKFDEQPRIEPQFETFGGHAQPGFQMQFGPPPLRNRSFFISNDENHLVQFQDDRLMLNWRQGSGATPYPRYENVLEKFNDAFSKLQSYFSSNLGVTLNVKQVDVSYINIIKITDFAEGAMFFNFINLSGLNTEGFSLKFSEIVLNNGKPVARLHHDLDSVWSVDGRQKAIRFSLTFRGKPENENLSSVIDFLNEGHSRIVQRFTDLTTEQAHVVWGKQR